MPFLWNFVSPKKKFCTFCNFAGHTLEECRSKNRVRKNNLYGPFGESSRPGYTPKPSYGPFGENSRPGYTPRPSYGPRNEYITDPNHNTRPTYDPKPEYNSGPDSNLNAGHIPNNQQSNRNPNITCFNCQLKGHYSNECPSPRVRRNSPGNNSRDVNPPKQNNTSPNNGVRNVRFCESELPLTEAMSIMNEEGEGKN